MPRVGINLAAILRQLVRLVTRLGSFGWFPAFYFLPLVELGVWANQFGWRKRQLNSPHERTFLEPK
jgi:hypothetical protein